jgi:predicted PhzF superfamily epimerase YddE/YHI9
LLKKIGEKVILTSKGNEVDFVSRFFAPVAGIDEDPVTGSAHSQLIPFWAER